MGRVKDKDIQYIYEVINESLEIQNLIKCIANEDNQTYMGEKINSSKEVKNLLEQKEAQLHDINENLKAYKEFYDSSKFKVDEYDNLMQKIKSQKAIYQSELARKENEIEKLKFDNSSLDSQKKDLLNELNSANEALKLLKKQFETPIKYFELYRGLSYSVKSGLANVINDKNVIEFIISCSSEENLSFIWEYIKDISNNIESRDFEVLNAIFDYFFDVFNKSFPEARYKRDDVEIGEDFDDDIYDRYSGSSTSGEITKVVLKGYQSMNTGKIIHKSLVKV